MSGRDGGAPPLADGTGLDTGELELLRRQIGEQVQTALQASGFPSRANPEQTSAVGLLLVLMLFCISATALYGPQAAALVELYPARIRYTAVSLPLSYRNRMGGRGPAGIRLCDGRRIGRHLFRTLVSCHRDRDQRRRDAVLAA